MHQCPPPKSVRRRSGFHSAGSLVAHLFRPIVPSASEASCDENRRLTGSGARFVFSHVSQSAREFRSAIAQTDTDDPREFSEAATRWRSNCAQLAPPLYEMSMNKRLGLQDKLVALQESDSYRKWYSLDDRRVCVLCEKLISGRMIEVWQDEIGTFLRPLSDARMPGHATGLVLLRSQKVAPAQGPCALETDPRLRFLPANRPIRNENRERRERSAPKAGSSVHGVTLDRRLPSQRLWRRAPSLRRIAEGSRTE